MDTNANGFLIKEDRRQNHGRGQGEGRGRMRGNAGREGNAGAAVVPSNRIADRRVFTSQPTPSGVGH